MLHKIKHLLIPHKHNAYHPHAIRLPALALFLLVLLSQHLAFNYFAQNELRVLGYATNISISDLLTFTNQERTSRGISALSLNNKLNSAAQSKAQHMIDYNYWAHVAPDGTTPWYFIDSTGYGYQKAGENLAYGFATSSGTVQGWMNSPSHAENLLDTNYSEVGFGIKDGANFQGDENTVVVAMYGQPHVASAQNTQPASTAQQSEPAPVAASEQPQSQPATAAEQTEEPQEEREPVVRASNPEVVVSSGALPQLNQSQSRISNYQALLSGQAHWSLYMSFGIVLTLGAIFVMKHATAAYQLAVQGEHYVVGHPMLEASIIYAAIWLLLAGTYGVVG